jgi:hypothetical protein
MEASELYLYLFNFLYEYGFKERDDCLILDNLSERVKQEFIKRLKEFDVFDNCSLSIASLNKISQSQLLFIKRDGCYEFEKGNLGLMALGRVNPDNEIICLSYVMF